MLFSKNAETAAWNPLVRLSRPVLLHCPIGPISYPTDALFGHVVRFVDKAFSSMSIYHLVDFPTVGGVVHLVVHGTASSTNSRDDSTRATTDLWRRTVGRGHSGATMRWPSTMMLMLSPNEMPCKM